MSETDKDRYFITFQYMDGSMIRYFTEEYTDEDLLYWKENLRNKDMDGNLLQGYSYMGKPVRNIRLMKLVDEINVDEKRSEDTNMNEEKKHTLLKIEFEKSYYIITHKDMNGDGVMKTKSFKFIASYMDIVLKHHNNIQAWDHLRVEGWFE